jgi:purine nucleosidase
MPIPVVLDTDIGTDIDDAYALLLAALSPELDLRAVTTVNNDVELRSKIAGKLLRLLGRDDIPVASGSGVSLTPGVTRGWGGHEGRGIDLSDMDPARDIASRDAAAVIAAAARAAHDEGNPLTILPVGAITNVALALEKHPQEMRLVGRIVAMASTFEGFGRDCARGEHNVACDPIAMDRVLRSGIPITLIGLNVTRQTAMTREQVEVWAERGGPVAQAVAGMHRVWFDFIRSDRSSMHDPLAVAVAFRPELVHLRPVKASVWLDALHPGTIVYNPPSSEEVTSCRIAVSVQADDFHALLQERIHSVAG